MSASQPTDLLGAAVLGTRAAYRRAQRHGYTLEFHAAGAIASWFPIVPVSADAANDMLAQEIAFYHEHGQTHPSETGSAEHVARASGTYCAEPMCPRLGVVSGFCAEHAPSDETGSASLAMASVVASVLVLLLVVLPLLSQLSASVTAMEGAL